jgi:hypothetical protein
MEEFENSIIKCFAITGNFDGGYSQVTGNFDDQGISFGFLQWSLGEGTLQSLLKAFYKEDPDNFHKCCTQYVPLYKKSMDLTEALLELASSNTEQAVAKSLKHQDKRFILHPHWLKTFHDLGNEPTFQHVQRLKAGTFIKRAKDYCLEYDLLTERSLALFFDTVVQQTSIKDATKYRIESQGFKRAGYEKKLEIIAASVSKQARDVWQREVLARRMCIVKSGGILNGKVYDLKKDYGLTDDIIIRTE